MSSAPGTPLDAIWTDLATRFDASVVERYRSLSKDPARAFETAHAEFRSEVAVLSRSGHDINRSDAKKLLILGHVLLAMLDGLRRGRSEWTPLPPRLTDGASEETSLLLWAAQHGASDIRERV
ncbi:MAG TPA: hypothetical protein VFV54_03780 [Thermoanaerobaculia bacterium]|nr:hypothetical protein [Thermoanaerobaculia bacterium]